MIETEYISRSERERMAEEYFKVDNSEDVEWITVKGNHIPVKKGQSKKDAIDKWLSDKEAGMSEEEHEEWEGKFDWHGFYEERDKHLTDREREKENRARDRYLKKLGKKYNFDPKDVPRY